MKFVKDRGYATNNSKKDYKEQTEETKEAEERSHMRVGKEKLGGEDAPVPLVTLVNYILYSFLTNVEKYMNHQQY